MEDNRKISFSTIFEIASNYAQTKFLDKSSQYSADIGGQKIIFGAKDNQSAQFIANYIDLFIFGCSNIISRIVNRLGSDKVLTINYDEKYIIIRDFYVEQELKSVIYYIIQNYSLHSAKLIKNFDNFLDLKKCLGSKL